jgi:O-antigen/teichoic acid export membrane protein
MEVGIATGDGSPPTVRRYRAGGQFIWVSGGRVVAALIQAITMVVLIRAVTPAEFGIFSAVYGVITVAQTALDLGLPTLVIRERSKDATNGIVAAALRLNNLLSLLLVCCLLTGLVTLGVMADVRFFLLLPLAIWAAAERNADAWLGVVFADGDAKINTANLVSRRIGNLLMFVGLSQFTKLDPVLAFCLSSMGAACLSWVFAHSYVAKRLPPSNNMTARQLVHESWPYWVNSVATQARNLDTAIAGIVSGPIQAGFYAAAARLTSPLRILPTSLASVLLPAAARRSSSTMGGILRLIGLSLGGMALIYATLAVLVPWAVPVFLGPGYVGGVRALQITMIGLVFAASASLLGAPLQAVGLKHYVASVAVVTTISCLLGVAIGATYFGAIGAAFGLSFSYLVQSIALLSRLALFIARKEPNR